MRYILILLVSLLLIGCQPENKEPQPIPTGAKAPNSQEYYVNKINKAKTINVEEDIVSIGKHYTIKIDGEKVATVEGKAVNMFGDEFKLKDINGNLLATEKEIKRWTHLGLERVAEIKDANGNTTGYFGEKYFEKVFSIGWTFFLYDPDKNESAMSDQVNLSVLKENNVYNNNKELVCNISSKFNPVYDEYVLKISNQNNIPIYHLIFLTCIEDAIHDAKNKK